MSRYTESAPLVGRYYVMYAGHQELLGSGFDSRHRLHLGDDARRNVPATAPIKTGRLASYEL